MMQLAGLIKAAQSRNGAAIADLFGDTGTRPTTKAPRHIENAAYGFPEFWAAWPANDRKVAKQKCLDKWVTMGCAPQWVHIIKHVEHMKRSDAWQRGFVPQPVTYLNQERWSEWIAPPERQVQAPVVAVQVSEEHKKAATGMPAELRAKLAAMRRKPE